MKANFVDLRTRSREILQALERNERVSLYYRGKLKAVIHPANESEKSERKSLADHPAVGMWKDREDMADVDAWLRNLRKGRFDAD